MSVEPALTPLFSAGDDLVWQAPFPGEQIALRVDSRDTAGRFAIGEGLIEPMAGPPLHIHHDADEVIYVLDGAVDFQCGDRRIQAGRGGFMVIPKGTPHGFRNFGPAPARLLGLFLPGGFEQMFVAMHGRPPEDFPQVAAEFALEVVGPPLEPAG